MGCSVFSLGTCSQAAAKHQRSPNGAKLKVLLDDQMPRSEGVEELSQGFQPGDLASAPKRVNQDNSRCNFN